MAMEPFRNHNRCVSKKKTPARLREEFLNGGLASGPVRGLVSGPRPSADRDQARGRARWYFLR